MQERQKKGKGMQNFHYTEQFLDLCRDLLITSPAAYRALAQVIKLPTERHLKKQSSNTPHFPFKLCDRTLDLVQEHLKDIEYKGPVGMGCDDTKLFSGLQLIWDPTEECHFLIGASDGPIRVANVDEVREAMELAKEKAGTKVCLLKRPLASYQLSDLELTAPSLDSFDTLPQNSTCYHCCHAHFRQSQGRSTG